MYSFLLPFHSVIRWLVLFSLLYAIYISLVGKRKQLPYTKKVNAVRHWTATLAHIQLVIGIILYTQSPIVTYFFSNGIGEWNDSLFFGLVHIIFMPIAIVIITIGSAKAKRKSTDSEKYQTMLRYFAIGLFIILIAIPWPFSPLAQRPYIRSF